VERVRGVLERERADGYLGLAAGVTYESDVEVEVEGEGGVQKGYAGVVVIGWESVEKHLAFRETDLFRENIGGLRNGARKIEMYHVQFMEAVVT
jgi:heme-degrading monooxygenase HmoA